MLGKPAKFILQKGTGQQDEDLSFFVKFPLNVERRLSLDFAVSRF